MRGSVSAQKPTIGASDYERSLQFSAAAQEKIRSLHHRPTPLNYEIWYVYASATNRKLNRAIDELANGGALSEDDLEQLYEVHLSKIETAEQVDKLSTDISSELKNAINLLNGARTTHSEYGEVLTVANHVLAGATEAHVIRGIVRQLISSTINICKESGQLKESLEGSTKEILVLQSRLEAVRIENQTDTLTGLSNRKRFNETIGASARCFAATGEPFSLMMLDIDHFKSFNDNFGHLTGDEVLRLVAQCVKQNVKGNDIAFRYGGEEFAVLLPNTELAQAFAAAENIRHAIMKKELKKKSTGEILGRITLSIGVASMVPDDSCETLIDRADGCLYAAKRAGRNRVSCKLDTPVDTRKTG